jgi:hypothetical protein
VEVGGYILRDVRISDYLYTIAVIPSRARMIGIFFTIFLISIIRVIARQAASFPLSGLSAGRSDIPHNIVYDITS